MEVNKSFIDKLILKLKSGDARSIHLDALPGRFARLDLYDLVNLETSLHHDFMGKLLSGKPFQFNIRIDLDKYKNKTPEEIELIKKIIKRLNTLYYQEQDEFAEMGTLSFGFGYPMLILRDPSSPARILKAPLLIWYLDIEKDSSRSNSWVLKRTEEHPILFNEVLKAHVENTAGVKWMNMEEWDEENPPNEPAIQSLCKEILASFNISPTEDELFPKILPCTNKQTIDHLTSQKPWIRWSGVFGLFKTQKQAIIKDLSDLANSGQVNISVTSESASTDALTPVQLDPSQETVLHYLSEYGKVIIQGPPGTGKSQSISAIITNALLEGKKILVVCEKRTAMEVIKNNLEALGLGELVVLIEDVYADRNQVVQRIRNIVEEGKEEVPYFKNFAFDFSKNKILSSRQLINQRVEALHKRVFGDDTWLDLAQKHSLIVSESLNWISYSISIEEHPANYNDWLRFHEMLDNQRDLFSKIGNASSVVESLPADYWLTQKSEDWSANVLQLYTLSRDLNRSLTKNAELFGSAFYDLGKMAKFSASIAGIFSSQKKALNEARDQTKNLYDQLYQLLEKMQWPEHMLTPLGLQHSMMHWHNQILPVLSIVEKIEPYNDQLSTIQNWLRFVKNAPLFLHPALEHLATIPDLVRSRIFDEWYFRQFLEQYAATNSMQKDGEFSIRELQENQQTISPLLAEKILFNWRTQSKETLRRQDNTEKRMLYNLRKNKQFTSRNSLRSILSKDFEFFTDVFPVMMVNPVVASAILPLKKGLMDLIIMDEASQLRVEDTFAALYRGHSHVISGDEHQMPPSSYFSSEIVLWDDQEDTENEKDQFLAESASLLEFAADAGYYPTYLDFHYRSKHPDLIAFSNAGFYGSRLIPMPPKKEYQAMFFHQVNGTYENSINTDEAKAVVEYVYTLAAEITDKMPSIGIGTLNIHQRDLIQDMLWETAFADPEKNRLMEQMSKAGLFVKNLENIQGDERDIILISTTFGTDSKGLFRQNFGPLNRQNGYQLLNVLITRAKISMHIFTSIPEQYYMHFEEELRANGNTGKSLLYAYLSFVKSVASKDPDRKEYILNVLRENSKNISKSRVKGKSILFPPFIRESIISKSKYPLKESVKIGGFELEAALETKDHYIYLQSERLSPHPKVHYRELLYRPAILQPFNIETQRIWAYEWWKYKNNVNLKIH